jgi:hypothetical protein
VFRIRYILAQKGVSNLPVLKHFKVFFNTGAIEKHSKLNVFSYIMSGCKNCYKVYPYYTKFPLYTKKAESLRIWSVIHEQISKKMHLTSKRIDLKELAKTINNRNCEHLQKKFEIELL